MSFFQVFPTCPWNMGPGQRSLGIACPEVKSLVPDKHTIRDKFQKVLVLDGDILIAVADKLNTPRETFYVLTSNKIGDMKESLIFLAVSNGELCLCCDKVEKPKEPSLQLKKKNITELNSLNEEECQPFTFIRQQTGSCFTLESKANRGYFIYSPKESGQAVGMTKEKGKENIDFVFDELNITCNETETDHAI